MSTFSRNSGGEMVHCKPGIPWRRSWIRLRNAHKAGLGTWDDYLVLLAGTSSHLDAALSGDRHTLFCGLYNCTQRRVVVDLSADVEVNHAGLVRHKPVVCSLNSPIQRVVPPILVIEACAATPRASVRLSVLEIQSDGDPDTGRIAPSCSCNTASMSRCMTTLGMVPISHHAPHTADCRSSTSSFVKVVLVLAAASRTPPTSSIRAWTSRSTLTCMSILARKPAISDSS